MNQNRDDLPRVFLINLLRFGTSGAYSPSCFQDRLFSSSVRLALILLSRNRRSKTQSTRQKESRQRKVNSASEKPWLSNYLISQHETMNSSLIVCLLDIRVRMMGILPTLYSSSFCLLCYLQSQRSLIFRNSYIRGFWIHHSTIRPKYPLFLPPPPLTIISEFVICIALL